MRIAFTLSPETREDGDFVVRSGKIFSVGSYPDKGFDLTEEEADDAVNAFVPAQLNVEHMPSIFDNILGTVRKIWREGKDILAEYAIPKWLHTATDGKPLKVSSEWDTFAGNKKRLTACALVLNPRVRDAAMMTAFSMRHDSDLEEARTLSAQFAASDLSFNQRRALLNAALYAFWQQENEYVYVSVQDIYDATLTFTDWDNDQLWRISYKVGNDYAVTFGTPEAVIATTHYEPAPANLVKPSKSKHSINILNSQLGNQQQISTTNTPKEPRMSKFSLTALKEWFTGQGVEVEDDITPPVQTPAADPVVIAPVKVEETAEFKAIKDKADRDAAELEALKQAQQDARKAEEAKFSVDNEAVIDGLIAAQKIDPAKKAEFVDKRAKAPDLFDEMVIPALTSKFSGSTFATPGTVDASDALLAVLKDQPAQATFNANVAALQEFTPGL